MLTILWIMTAAAVVAMGAALAARHGVVEGASRVWLERARWEALGCERRAVASIDRILADAATFSDAAVAWRTLSGRLADTTRVDGCELALAAAGTRVDVNRATPEMLARLFDALGLEGEAPALVDALEDWIDADGDPRPYGAERDWYQSAGRILPRNDSLADLRELGRVRAFEDLAGMDSVLTTEPGRVSLSAAPVPVLMAVPGITRETAEQIVALARAGTPIADLRDVVPLVSLSAAMELEARYPDAVRVTTPDPDAWLVRARVAHGVPAVTVQLEWRVIRVGRRCAVAGTRSQL